VFLCPDYSVFSSASFDPNEYANAILAGEPYLPQSNTKVFSKPTLNLTKSAAQDSIAKEDLSVAISKLTFGIDDVSKQVKSLVCPPASSICSPPDFSRWLSITKTFYNKPLMPIKWAARLLPSDKVSGT
jgi:hypothetical protein